VPAGGSIALAVAERAGVITVKDAPGFPKVAKVYASPTGTGKSGQRRYGGAGPMVVEPGRYDVACEFEGKNVSEAIGSGIEVQAGKAIRVGK
jgi:hypothetical protein